jgi:hypothetical protein
MRRFPAWLPVPVLLLGVLGGGCGGDAGSGPAASLSGSPGSSSTPPGSSSTPAGSVPRSASVSSPAVGSTSAESGRPWPRCDNADGFSVAYPPDWVTTPQGGAAQGCAWFGPAPFTVVPNSDERPTPIAVKVERVPFDTVSAPGPGQSARVSTTVAARRAFRIEERATGDGLLPAGTAVVRYAVDVEGVVPDGGTLVLDLQGSPGVDVRTLAPVLDRMAASVRLMGR